MKLSIWNNMHSNPSIASPSLRTHESLWIEIPCDYIFIYRHTQYTVTTAVSKQWCYMAVCLYIFPIAQVRPVSKIQKENAVSFYSWLVPIRADFLTEISESVHRYLKITKNRCVHFLFCWMQFTFLLLLSTAYTAG